MWGGRILDEGRNYYWYSYFYYGQFVLAITATNFLKQTGMYQWGHSLQGVGRREPVAPHFKVKGSAQQLKQQRYALRLCRNLQNSSPLSSKLQVLFLKTQYSHLKNQLCYPLSLGVYQKVPNCAVRRNSPPLTVIKRGRDRHKCFHMGNLWLFSDSFHCLFWSSPLPWSLIVL